MVGGDDDQVGGRDGLGGDRLHRRKLAVHLHGGLPAQPLGGLLERRAARKVVAMPLGQAVMRITFMRGLPGVVAAKAVDARLLLE